MNVWTLLLLAFVCGLLAGKVLDLCRTLIIKLQRIRIEIDLGREGVLAPQEQLPQDAVKSRPIHAADAKSALKQVKHADKNVSDSS